MREWLVMLWSSDNGPHRGTPMFPGLRPLGRSRLRVVTAVDVDTGTGDERRPLACQESDRRANLLGAAVAPERGACFSAGSRERAAARIISVSIGPGWMTLTVMPWARGRAPTPRV